MNISIKWIRAICAASVLSIGSAQAKDVLDPELLQTRLTNFIAGEIRNQHLLGAVAMVVQDGKTVLLLSDGVVDTEQVRPMSDESLFRIASMTKPIVSVAALQAVEAGLIGLDDPIAKYLPELADLKIRTADGTLIAPERQPLVYDLLRHTGGFTYSFAGAAAKEVRQAYRGADIEQMRGDMAADEMLEKLADIPLAFQPGTRFEYSIGVDLLGFILERVHGKRLDEVLNEQVLAPLGMTHTSFKVAPTDSGRLAEAPPSDPMKPFTEGWMRVAADRNDGYLSAGGGLVSTAGDYLRFAQMLLNGGELDGIRLLSPATVRLMTANHIEGMLGGPQPFTGPGYGFGLGLATRLNDGGAFVGGTRGDLNWSGLNGTTFTIDPEDDLVAIFMAAAPSNRGHLRFAFRNIVYGAMRPETTSTN